MPCEWAAVRRHSLPVTPVRRGPWAIHALADTGAQTSLIHPRLVLQFGLSTTSDLPVVGIGSQPLQVSRVRLTDLHVTPLPLKEFDAGVTTLDNLGLDIDLILGVNALAGYCLQFDFTQDRLYLLTE